MLKFSQLLLESSEDLYSVITTTIADYQNLKKVEISLDSKELEYYEMFYSVSSTTDDLVTVVNIDIKDWDISVGASDEYIELFGKDDSQAEKDLLIKLRDNAEQLVSYRQLILLKALEDLMKI
jgi:hypothetical protein